MQLLCFDLDNTLVYSTKVHLLAFQKAFEKNKLQKKSKEQILRYFSLESAQMIKKLYPHLKKKEILKVTKDHDTYVLKQTAKYIKVIPGAKKTLKKLKKNYEIAILSNCKHKEILSILKHAKIERSIFDKIIGNDEVKHPKPAPDEIIKAKQLLKLNDGYMIGDSIYDIRAGKKAKVKTIAVCTGSHTKTELQKEKPSAILKSIKELENFLKKEAPCE